MANGQVAYYYNNLLRWDDFNNNQMPSGWTKSATGVTFSEGQMHISGPGAWTVFASRTEGVGDGGGAQFAFKMSSAGAVATIFFDSGSWGPDYRRWGLVISNGTIYRNYYQGTSGYDTPLVSLEAGVWYEAILVVDGTGQFRVRLWKQSNPGVVYEDTASLPDSSGRSWKFYDYQVSGVQDMDDYREVQWDKALQRSGMQDGSGWTAWSYDARGRITQESKTITGSGTFVTQWGYNSADQVTWMKYPANNTGGIGEQVSYTYLSQMALKNMFSDTNSYYYLQLAKYDAAGGTVWSGLGAANLGANPVLVSKATFNPWAVQGGRLQRLTTGLFADDTSLQDLSYTYDNAGNILTIADAKVAGGTQTQIFTYNSLNRLASAIASGGSGAAPANGLYALQHYHYNDASGNLSAKGPDGSETGYTYSAVTDPLCPNNSRSIPHAVSAAGGNTFSYDCNGNMTGRTINGAAYTLTYDAVNRLTGVSGSSSAVYVYDGDGNRVKETTYRNLAAGIPVTVASGVILLNPGAVTNGDIWADSSDPNTGEFAITSPDGTRYVQIDLGAVYTVDKVKVWHYTESGNPYTYHNPKTEVSSNGTYWTTVSGSGEYQETADGKTYTFTAQAVRYIRDTINGSNRNANNRWVEIEAWGNASTTFVGNYFEWASNSDGLTNTGSTKTYYAAGQRLAIRRTGYADGGNELLWLLSDHLGSTTVTAYANGSFYSELRYTPWGETRYSSQSGMIIPPGSQNRTPTSFRFTGQRSEEDAIGLYYYNARWYDPWLGRFTQADSIIPNPANSASFDRYAYVANNPINSNDPSGHKENTPDPSGQYKENTALQYAWVTLNVNICDDIGKIQDTGTPFAQEYQTFAGKETKYTYHNLCGHIAATVILEAITGQKGMLDETIGFLDLRDMGIDRDGHKIDAGTGASAVVAILNHFLPPGWFAETLAGIWWLDQNGNNCIQSVIVEELNLGIYLIVGVRMSDAGDLVASGGFGHWVTIIGYGKAGVYYYDPYTNSKRTANWDVFINSMMAFDTLSNTKSNPVMIAVHRRYPKKVYSAI